MEVDKSINLLLKNGASISKEDLKLLRKFVVCNKKRNVEYIYQELMEELADITYKYLNSPAINGISSSINLEQVDLNIYGGPGINYDTEYDIASITKLFTLVLVWKYIDNGLLRLTDKVCDIDYHFSYLDYTIEDLIKMSGHIVTDLRIDLAHSQDEAYQRLHSIHADSYDKEVNNYTDIGFMVLATIIEHINNRRFEDIIVDFYDSYGIKINQKKNVVGNGHTDILPHDPKTRIIGRCFGSAGIFINSENMMTMASKLFNDRDLISKDNLYKLSHKLFKANHANKGYGGVYVKHPLGIKKSSTPNAYSNLAFSHQGYTGSCAIFDPLNNIHNSILVDAIMENQKKDSSFYKYFNDYHEYLIMITLKTYLTQKQHQHNKMKIIQRL